MQDVNSEGIILTGKTVTHVIEQNEKQSDKRISAAKLKSAVAPLLLPLTPAVTLSSSPTITSLDQKPPGHSALLNEALPSP